MRLSGQVMGLTFFAYDTSLVLTVPPGGSETRQYALDLTDLDGQATGLVIGALSVQDAPGNGAGPGGDGVRRPGLHPLGLRHLRPGRGRDDPGVPRRRPPRHDPPHAPRQPLEAGPAVPHPRDRAGPVDRVHPLRPAGVRAPDGALAADHAGLRGRVLPARLSHAVARRRGGVGRDAWASRSPPTGDPRHRAGGRRPPRLRDRWGARAGRVGHRPGCPPPAAGPRGRHQGAAAGLRRRPRRAGPFRGRGPAAGRPRPPPRGARLRLRGDRRPVPAGDGEAHRRHPVEPVHRHGRHRRRGRGRGAWPRAPRCTSPTAGACCTATSSRRTSCSRPRGR